MDSRQYCAVQTTCRGDAKYQDVQVHREPRARNLMSTSASLPPTTASTQERRCVLCHWFNDPHKHKHTLNQLDVGFMWFCGFCTCSFSHFYYFVWYLLIVFIWIHLRLMLSKGTVTHTQLILLIAHIIFTKKWNKRDSVRLQDLQESSNNSSSL